MQNFSFFEIIEAQAPMVIKALNKVVLNGGRKVIVEVAGENNGKSDKDGKKRSRKEREGEEKGSKRNSKKESREMAPKAEKKAEKKAKPSREERGYTAARGPKHKDDWKQFFQHDNDRPLKGEIPDFAEEGWAKRKK